VSADNPHAPMEWPEGVRGGQAMRRVLVHTQEIRPPIPTRNCDWLATLDNYEPGQPIGHGPTEADAVCDLYVQIAEREADEDDKRAS
jgi:hypothetical protein